MPKSENQKLKIFYVLKCFFETSDENTPICSEDIIKYLAKRNIEAENRSIYRDINLLRNELGIDIDGRRGTKYRLMSRDFKFSDLRILVECIHSAKFISTSKSKELVKLLGKFCSEKQRKTLETDTLLYDRAKTTQNGVIQAIDDINRAMTKKKDCEPKKISFKYLKYTIDNVHRQAERRKGNTYIVSPYKLLISNGNYYLLAFADKEQKLITYRVDRMKDVKILNIPREGEEVFAAVDINTYSQRVFGMYGGTKETVTMRFVNSLLDTVVDQFKTGANAIYKPDDKNHFKVVADVEVSPQFFGWICGFGNRAVIESPQNVVDDFQKHIEKIQSKYKE